MAATILKTGNSPIPDYVFRSHIQEPILRSMSSDVGSYTPSLNVTYDISAIDCHGRQNYLTRPVPETAILELVGSDANKCSPHARGTKMWLCHKCSHYVLDCWDICDECDHPKCKLCKDYEAKDESGQSRSFLQTGAFDCYNTILRLGGTDSTGIYKVPTRYCEGCGNDVDGPLDAGCSVCGRHYTK